MPRGQRATIRHRHHVVAPEARRLDQRSTNRSLFRSHGAIRCGVLGPSGQSVIAGLIDTRRTGWRRCGTRLLMARQRLLRLRQQEPIEHLWVKPPRADELLAQAIHLAAHQFLVSVDDAVELALRELGGYAPVGLLTLGHACAAADDALDDLIRHDVAD